MPTTRDSIGIGLEDIEESVYELLSWDLPGRSRYTPATRICVDASTRNALRARR
jgi:hypothetical protein